YSLNEYADGSRWHQSAALIPPYSSDRGPELCEVQHSESLVPGTRQLQGVRLELRRGNGELLTVAATPLSMVYMSGIGYGPPWRHGVYQGENVAEDEVWDLGDTETRRRVFGLTETLCRWEMNGRTGYGVFEFICVGPYAPLGLQSGTDVAP
ncbi:MAG TPA: hypothetical protein VFD32_12330, partial [Dehalococcoidia bacterium]|nr:hypothetical protein [Dehalococcoidia bacterium]